MVARGCDRVKWAVTEFSLGDDEKVPKLDNGDGCTPF